MKFRVRLPWAAASLVGLLIGLMTASPGPAAGAASVGRPGSALPGAIARGARASEPSLATKTLPCSFADLLASPGCNRGREHTPSSTPASTGDRTTSRIDVAALGSAVEEVLPVLEVASVLGVLWGRMALDVLPEVVGSGSEGGWWAGRSPAQRRFLAGAIEKAVSLGALVASGALASDDDAVEPAASEELSAPAAGERCPEGSSPRFSPSRA